jgi:hypothetical protein
MNKPTYPSIVQKALVRAQKQQDTGNMSGGGGGIPINLVSSNGSHDMISLLSTSSEMPINGGAVEPINNSMMSMLSTCGSQSLPNNISLHSLPEPDVGLRGGGLFDKRENYQSPPVKPSAFAALGSIVACIAAVIAFIHVLREEHMGEKEKNRKTAFAVGAMVCMTFSLASAWSGYGRVGGRMIAIAGMGCLGASMWTTHHQMVGWKLSLLIIASLGGVAAIAT